MKPMRRLLLFNIPLLLIAGCVSAERNGVIVPTKFAGQFSIPRSEAPAGTPRAYLNSFVWGDGVQRYYLVLLLWQNGTAAHAGMFTFHPGSTQITLNSLAEVGHYRIVGKNQIELEMFGASVERRVFFTSRGDYGPKVITIKTVQRRGAPEASSIMDRYEYDPTLVTAIRPTW